jgi:hypothetical protein
MVKVHYLTALCCYEQKFFFAYIYLANYAKCAKGYIYMNRSDAKNVEQKCCAIVYAKVSLKELKAVIKRLRKIRSVLRIDYDHADDGSNLTFTIIADNFSQLKKTIQSHCNFPVKLRYGYLNVLLDKYRNF